MGGGGCLPNSNSNVGRQKVIRKREVLCQKLMGKGHGTKSDVGKRGVAKE